VTAYVLCVALAAVLGWIHHQWHTTNLPAPAEAAAMSNWPSHIEQRRGGGPDLAAILVTRPALYHTLTSLYVYNPEPMSPWLADEETRQATHCRDMGIQWRGLAQP
jgi:hypothetical protein